MIVFFGSPLLDIIAKVDQNFLKKYNLKPDNAVKATPELEGIFKDIEKYNPILQPGGSVTNTTRVFNWVSKKSYPTSFIGPIGDDDYGKIIENKLKEEDIDTHLIKVQNEKTGTCAVLLTDENRSMVTHLGASKFFSENNLDEKLWKIISKATYLYLSAYLIRANFKVMEILIKHFLENDKFIIINLAASFVSQKYPKEVAYLFENADMVFGNESEYVSFAKILEIETTNQPDLLDKVNKHFKSKSVRTLIMTRGSKSIFIKHENTIEEFDVPHLDEEQIIDTNAAGDAFVGGFLAQFVKNKPISDCVKCGIWSSKEIIRNHGCNFNNKLVYDYMPFISTQRKQYEVYLIAQVSGYEKKNDCFGEFRKNLIGLMAIWTNSEAILSDGKHLWDIFGTYLCCLGLDSGLDYNKRRSN